MYHEEYDQNCFSHKQELHTLTLNAHSPVCIMYRHIILCFIAPFSLAARIRQIPLMLLLLHQNAIFHWLLKTITNLKCILFIYTILQSLINNKTLELRLHCHLYYCLYNRYNNHCDFSYDNDMKLEILSGHSQTKNVWYNVVILLHKFMAWLYIC